ncbi:MAG: IS200/IS605 family transposase [Salinivirgaceae bacterium]
MPYVKVYIHFVWSTKNRHPYLTTLDLREKVWKHILENAKEKGIYIDFIGGYIDHCHCLVSMGIDQTIKDLAQMIKGESSFWINKQDFCKSQFNWQNDYFVASVSESMIDATRNYIKNQENHHKDRSFKDEYNDFLEKHGFKKIDD